MGVAVNRIFALLWFLLGVTSVSLGIFSPEGIMAAYFGFLIFLLPGSMWLFRAVFRPFGQAPADY
jgi:hypothetical protein